MSRTRIVGGNLIKITGGTYRIFAKKGIEFHSNGKIIMNAEEVQYMVNQRAPL
ncbi:hypothetical protein V3468_07445 [Flavobacterium oreochromis]|uniref:hypothetical protein n=1 Tax=Flavobacterium oreochromis TaxID=2906078 RepID=UPI00385A9C1C